MSKVARQLIKKKIYRATMSEITFPSKIKVHRWLLDNGWQISQSQFYDHCKDGLLRPRKGDGKYTLQSVEKYALINVKKAETGAKVNDQEDKIRHEKLEISLQRERLALEADTFDKEKRHGKFVAKADFEMAIVARAVTFMAHLNHSINKEAQDWIDLVEGDQQRAPELVNAIVNTIEQRMGDFAVDAEFDVILEANN